MNDKQFEQLAVTPEKAAKILGISRNLAYRLCATGELPAIRLGRRWLVPVEALKRMLAQAEQAERDKNKNGGV